MPPGDSAVRSSGFAAIANRDMRLPLAALSSVFLILSYPKFSLGFLAWLALAPLFAALRNCRSAKQAALTGAFAGFIFYSGILYWIRDTCVAGGTGQPLAILAWLALAAVLSLEWAVFGAYIYRIRNGGYLFPVAAAAGWTAIEWAKISVCRIASWFPWFALGYTQWRHPALIQIASITGAYGVSFALAFSGAALAGLFFKGPPNAKKILPPIIAAALCAGLFVFGRAELNKSASRSSGAELKICLLQPDIDQYKKWDAQVVGWIEDRISGQLARAAAEKPLLIVWPEAALPGWIEDEKYKLWTSTLAQAANAYQLIGSVSRRDKNYVSAFLVNPKGEIAGVYDKRQLVPFGETVPFRPFLEKFVTVLGKLGEFSAGARSQPPLEAGGVKLGAAICYETIFPYLWRESAGAGAQVFVNIVNDGWYLDTAGPRQHFIGSVFRAVETRTPLLRAANTGISAFIDPWGRIVKESGLNVPAVLAFDVQAAAPGASSPYVKYGDWFALLCAAAAAAFALICKAIN